MRHTWHLTYCGRFLFLGDEPMNLLRSGLTILHAIALGICTLAVMAGSAHAQILGSAYFVSEAQSQNAVIGFPHGAANATFSVPNGPINFTSAPGYTLSQFLLSNPGTSILTGSAGDLSRALDTAAGGTMLELTGQVSVINGQTFTVQHDDGLQLMVGGLLVVNVPGPTAPVVTTVTYTGPTGTFAFDLVYGECCGAPAVLATSLPLQAAPAVPEPETYAMLLAGLGLMGFVARRRKQRAA